MERKKKWKRHPVFRELWISNDGKGFRLNEKPLKIKDHRLKPGKILKVVSVNRAYYSAPKLILETWGAAKPEDGRRYYALYRDGNKENLHPENLYWGNNLMSRNELFEKNLRQSKLSKDQTYEAYHRNKFKGESIASIAKDMKVSDMSIHRAIKRLSRKIEETRKNNS
ncbi:hypothetical protein [Salinimicrobium flavum]|uniref:HNH endonuclease n=1 Tax=Salinimicrobium flavum TaxID=1737065 RepID=A0ABW5IRT7_9FLAO